MKKNILLTIALILIAVVLVASCSGATSSPTAPTTTAPTTTAPTTTAPTTTAPTTTAPTTTAPKPPIKVGVITWTTGGAKSFGDHSLQGIEMAVKELNAQGGILGGRMIEYKVFDEGYSSDTSVTSAKEAVDWGAKIIVGGAQVSTAEPMQVAIQEAGIPLVTLTTAGVDGRLKYRKPGTFFTFPSGPSYGWAWCRWVQANSAKYGWKSVMAVEWDSGYEVQIGDPILFAYFEGPESTMTALPSIWVPYGTSDLTVELTKAVALNPGFIKLSVYGDEVAIRSLQKLRELGYKGGVWMSGNLNGNVATQLGADFDYPLFFDYSFFVPDPSIPESLAFNNNYKAAYGSDAEPETFVDNGYEAMMIAAKGMDIAGNTAVENSDLAAIDAAFYKVDWTTPRGTKVKFFTDGTGQIDYGRAWAVKLLDGKVAIDSYLPLIQSEYYNVSYK